nr:unnamed protein product [Digitaria exilis]
MSSCRGSRCSSWLRSLPLASKFHPTVLEFAVIVTYLLRIKPAAAPFNFIYKKKLLRRQGSLPLGSSHHSM